MSEHRMNQQNQFTQPPDALYRTPPPLLAALRRSCFPHCCPASPSGAKCVVWHAVARPRVPALGSHSSQRPITAAISYGVGLWHE